MESAYRTSAPSPALRPFVLRFWEFDSSNTALPLSGIRKVVPDASAGLIINIESFSWIDFGGQWQETPSALIQGIVNKPYLLQSDGPTHAFGIHFKPEGLLSLFGLTQQELVNQFGDLEGLLGGAMQYFVERIQNAGTFEVRIQQAEVFLLGQLARMKQPLPYLPHALQEIRASHGQLEVQALADRVFVGRRQLERQFDACFGLSPKVFLRIERFQHALKLAQKPGPNWSQIAFECGYADQAHLIRDFRALAGDAPGEVLRQKALLARFG